MGFDLHEDVERVSNITAVPTILDVVCRTTGMRFAAVARVSEERWVACSVLDQIGFGLKPGGELDLETTICHEVRQSRTPVVIDNVAEDQNWCTHPTPAMYGFQSYISMPIVLEDGSFFGTLCAIDPRPAQLRKPETIGMFQLFADLIGKNLDAQQRLAVSEEALRKERELAELREQFIAVLGHDLRTPLRAFKSFSGLLLRMPLSEDAASMTRLMLDSASRMQIMIDNMLDLARGRLGGGMKLALEAETPLEPVLRTVLAELRVSQPERAVEAEFSLAEPVRCDRSRIAQLLSNLLGNALTYGAPDQPVRVRAVSRAGVFELSVANAGEPIPPAALDQLFQPFFRGSSYNSEGLGLGLYIAHQIAVAHGGTLSVVSSPEETQFTFRMPTAGEALLARAQQT